MAATTITRSTLTDSTSPSTGDIWNAALVGTSVYDKVDALFTASLTIARSSSGDIAFTVQNLSNTANSDALLSATVAGTSAGDPYASFVVTSGSTFSIGVDNSDSDLFKISGSAALGTTDVFAISTAGKAGLGSGTLTNSTMTAGLTLSQGAADDAILAFKSSDVTHGITSLADTDVYGIVQKVAGADGGMELRGFTEVSIGLKLSGISTTGVTTKLTTSDGYINIVAAKKSGTTAAAPAANENLVVIQSSAATTHIFDADGDIHYHGAAPAAFDEYDDAKLCRALDLAIAERGTIRSTFDRFVAYRRDDLVAAGVLSDGGFVNLTQHTKLLNGAIWQLYTQQARLKTAQARIAKDIKALKGAA